MATIALILIIGCCYWFLDELAKIEMKKRCIKDQNNNVIKLIKAKEYNNNKTNE